MALIERTIDIYINTGRKYTAEGQVIRLVLDEPTDVIHFADFSRGCNGVVSASLLPFSSRSLSCEGEDGYDGYRPDDIPMLVSHFLREYDQNKYTFSMESFEMLMLEGRDSDAEVHKAPYMKIHNEWLASRR